MLQLSSAPVRPIPRAAGAGGHRRRRDLRRRHGDAARYRRRRALCGRRAAGDGLRRTRRGILIVAGGCAALTVLSYVITHEHDPASGPFLRCLISLVAIAITGALAARHQGTIEALREHASLLDLTHDTIFVRNHDDVITYWNRAATELYGWRPEQAIGRKAAELLQTEFPAPFDDDHVRARRAPDAGKANWCIPPATAGVSSWPAAGPCSATAAAGRRPSSRPTTTSPSAAQVEDGLHRAQQRARPCRARRHPGRAHRLDRP